MRSLRRNPYIRSIKIVRWIDLLSSELFDSGKYLDEGLPYDLVIDDMSLARVVFPARELACYIRSLTVNVAIVHGDPPILELDPLVDELHTLAKQNVFILIDERHPHNPD